MDWKAHYLVKKRRVRKEPDVDQEQDVGKVTEIVHCTT